MKLLYLLVFAFVLCTIVHCKVVSHDLWVAEQYMEVGPDGRSKTVHAINGAVPGPTIEADLGDIIEATVHNNGTQNITMHWHGMDQHGTNEMDGVDGVTQCSIPPGHFFTYRFVARPAGTAWYHSHTGMQYSDGMYGVLIVREPPGEESTDSLDISHLYDEERVLIYSEVFEKMGADIIHDLENGGFTGGAISDIPFESGTLNGKGRFDDSYADVTELEVIKVKKGKRYRLRTINGCSSFGIRFSIDDHPLTIISTTADFVNPLDVKSCVTYPGERYDYILVANQPVGNYWIRMETATGEGWRGILRYDGAPEEEPVEPTTPPKTSQLHKIQQYYKRQGIKTHCCNNGTWPNTLPCCTANMGNFHPPVLTAKPPTLPPPPKVTKNVTFNILGSMKPNYFLYLNKIVFSLAHVDIPVMYTRGQFGVLPNVPYVPNLPYPPELQFIYDGLERGTNVIPLGHEEVVQIVVNNAGPMAHPVHLHGHRLYHLGVGPDRILEELADIGDAQPFDPEKDTAALNLINPPLVDTITIPAKGWGVFRFVASNPGAWILHCHIDAHLDTGMIAVFISDVPNSPQTNAFLDTCFTDSTDELTHVQNIRISKANRKTARLEWDLPEKGEPFFYRVAVKEADDDEFSFREVDMNCKKTYTKIENLVAGRNYTAYIEVTNELALTARRTFHFTHLGDSSRPSPSRSSRSPPSHSSPRSSPSHSSSSSPSEKSSSKKSDSSSSNSDSGDSHKYIVIFVAVGVGAALIAVVAAVMMVRYKKQRQRIRIPKGDHRRQVLMAED